MIRIEPEYLDWGCWVAWDAHFDDISWWMSVMRNNKHKPLPIIGDSHQWWLLIHSYIPMPCITISSSKHSSVTIYNQCFLCSIVQWGFQNWVAPTTPHMLVLNHVLEAAASESFWLPRTKVEVSPTCIYLHTTSAMQHIYPSRGPPRTIVLISQLLIMATHP